MDVIILFIWAVIALIIVRYLRVLLIFHLSAFSLYLTNSTKLSKMLYVIIFFPGVILHELSHLLVAMALNVRTGDINIFPQESQEGLQLGSVKIAKTDSIRGAIIGSAPLVIGLLLIYIIILFQYPIVFSTQDLKINSLLSMSFSLKDFFAFYLIFAISNSMILSKSDKREIIPAAIFIFAFLGVFYLLPKPTLNVERIFNVVARITVVIPVIFSCVAAINLLFIVPLACITRLMEKVTGKRIRLKT